MSGLVPSLVTPDYGTCACAANGLRFSLRTTTANGPQAQRVGAPTRRVDLGALDAHGPAATEPARRPRSFANVSVLELRNPGLRHSHSGFRFQIFRFQIPDFRFQISDFRSRISDFRFILSDFRYQISDFEFQFSDPKPSRCTDPADFLISDFFFQISSFFFQISRARPAAGGKPAGHIARRRRKNREVMGSTPIGEAFAFFVVWCVSGGGGWGGGAGEEAVEQPRASSLLLAKSPERERPFGSQELLPPGASSPWMCALLVSLLASVIVRPVLAPSTT